MENTNTNARYATLDGLRGLGALFVLVQHFPSMYHVSLLNRAYLAVDLFFAMSGFVIGSAYDRKIASGSLKIHQYILQRLVRLYPLYLAGLALGVVALMVRLPTYYWAEMASALPASVLMLPSRVALPIFYPALTTYDLSYPLDFPAWSLFFELVASLGYGLLFRFLNTRTLLLIMGASGVALGIASYTSTLNSGVLWSSFYQGFARVGYAFAAGLLLYRHRGPGQSRNHLATVGVLVAVVALLAFSWPVAHRHASDLFLALVVPPALVWVITRVEPPRRFLGLCAFSGMVSYGIYAMHVPLEILLQETLYRIHGLPHPGGITALLLIPGAVLLAWATNRYYDTPVRRAVLARARGRRTAGPVSGSASA
ncbi:acyltransferase [Paraburkholderia sp. J76]|uniref:acyltransferase family protein n=1 Tax=Paraburkholderia sp. J76 TaxID=2805439 RepID=UPI002ABD20F5|nr:acyltransferase [Paraburkholderia sp. J76]